MEAADSLQPVTVVADRGLVVSRTDTVDIVNSISITDAIGKASGLSVMDNGGASGLKTVSLRGLGSAHTAIYLDGVRVGNVQSGQTDLGMFDSESFSGIFDGPGKDRHVFSPSLDIRWDVFKGFCITAFGRRSNRVPTFNELYYPAFGNPDLKAEDAWLTDFGLGYDCIPAEGLRVTVKADAFFNYLKDKIISAPTADDPNIWLPFNVGVVMAAGTEIQTGITYADADWTAGSSLRYNFQDAVDRTPGSETEGLQLPYVARHSVCLDANASLRGWWLDLDWRWRGGRRDTYGELPDYNTLNLTAGKDISLPKDLVLGLKFLARNLTDCRYELSSGYPMPGRAFFGEIVFKF